MYLFCIFGILLIPQIFAVTNLTVENTESNSQNPSSLKILEIHWDHVEPYFIISLWILVICFLRAVHRLFDQLYNVIPGSAVMLIFGILFGFAIMWLNIDQKYFTFDSSIFFLVILPPIMLDAGYFMPNRQLFDNFGTVMTLAAAGTISNAIAICATLYFFGEAGLFSTPFTLFEVLLFAAPISAVDPVAVIAVFEEIHVNDFLFIHVFGESLFNDSITVVLYIMFLKFIALGEENIRWFHYLAVGGSFFIIAGGGILIGIFAAVTVALMTKFSTDLPAVSQICIFVVPYLAYLTAELFGMSSIFAIVVCGILMKDYIKANVSIETRIFTKQSIKALAQCTENLAFFFLGITAVIGDLHWDFAFIGFSLLCCLVYRIIAVIVQCAILNPLRKQKFGYVEQIILCFSGLRGAIAYGLAASMPETIKAKPMFLASCMACIFFSVFVQGIAIRPLLNFLNVERKNMESQTVAENFNNRMADVTMEGIENIAGISDKNSLRKKLEKFNMKYLIPFLTISKEDNANAIILKRKYQNVLIENVFAYN